MVTSKIEVEQASSQVSFLDATTDLISFRLEELKSLIRTLDARILQYTTSDEPQSYEMTMIIFRRFDLVDKLENILRVLEAE